MELDSREFGTGLLEYLRRNSVWDATARQLVRVPFIAVEETAEPQRRRPALALVPFLAAFITGLAG